MRKKAVEKLGVPFMESINKFQEGGEVGGDKKERNESALARTIAGARLGMMSGMDILVRVKKGIAENKFAQGGLIVRQSDKIIGGYQEGGVVNNITTQLIPQEPTQAPQTNYNISISAPLLDDTVVDSIIPAIDRARREGLA